jgi:integrase
VKAAGRLTDALARSCAPTEREYSLHDAVLRGFALRVRPCGTKTWVLRTRQGGRPQRVTLGDPPGVSAETARQRAHALLSGPCDAPSSPASSTLTLKRFATVYLERRASDWRASTQRTNESYLTGRILPTLGRRPLARIGIPDVAAWFHEYSRTRPGGANRALAVLSDLFSRALVWGVLPPGHPNPCLAVRRNKSRSRGQMLNADALARLGVVLAEHALVQPAAVDAIRLLLLTGARPGEICGLRWGEVEKDRIVLTQAKRGPRSIPLGRAAIAVLDARRKRRTASPFVFPHRSDPNSSMPLPTKTTWNIFKREAKLPASVRLHDLRHNFASHALLAGESLLVASALLGHRRPTMTARYAHIADDSFVAAAQRISSAIFAMER